MENITPEPIMRTALGFMAAKHLFIANEIGLFEKLSKGSLTLEALAERMVVPPRTTRIIADAMVVLGFIQRRGNHYQNGDTAAAFLSGEPSTGLRPFLRLMNRISYPAWHRLEDAVRSGEASTDLGHFSAEEQEIYSAGVETFTGAAARSLAHAYDFGRHRRVLDVGGGTGSFLLAILHEHHNLKGTLFELPSVTDVAEKRLTEEAEAGSITIIAGDFFDDPLPDGHDVAIVANVAHCLSKEHNVDLLRRLRQHSEIGTRLLMVDLWTDSTHTRPNAAPLMAGEFLVMCGEGDVYSEDDVEEWFRATGWQMIERKSLTEPMSAIVAEAVPR
jgi:SAM-dependent methyltransferase